MKKRPRNKIPNRSDVLIFCDSIGITELDYFKSMKQDRYSKSNVHIKPKFPKHQGFGKTIEEVDCILKDKTAPKPKYVFIVIDMDIIHSQNMFPDYRQRRESLIAKWGKNRVFFIESRPCFEFWLLMHYRFVDKLYVTCDGLINDLRKHLDGYNKKESYRRQVYDLTKNEIDTAIDNATKVLNKQRTAGEEFSYTRLPELIRSIDSL